MVPRLRSEGLQPGAGDLRRRCTAVCFDYWFPGISTSRKPIVLSLAHLTSWSAERIARAATLKFPEENNAILAEEVWDFYMAWVEHLPRCRSRLEDMEGSMWEIIQQLRFDILGPCAKERNLSKTPRPTTFTYARLWLPTERYSGPEIPSFLPEDGIDNYRACMRLAENGPMTCFTQAELKIIEQLGPHVRPMIRTVMNECMEYLERDMMTGEFSRKIFDLHRHLGKIMQLGNRVVELWCHTFGSVEVFADSWNVRVRRDEESEYDEQVDEVVTQLKDHVETSKRRQIKKSIAKTQGRCLVYLNSSPQAIKMLVICMVTDRIHALDELRHKRRQETGGTLVSIEDLPSDAKDCPICRETLGVESEAGEIEYPVRLVSCCGQYAGERCLQEWYRSPEGRSCPLCRRTPSSSFFEKLYQVEFQFPPSPTIMFLMRAGEQPQFIPTIPERGAEISEEQLQALRGGRDVSVTIGDDVMIVRQQTASERALPQLD
ncbi:hypothetical protein VE00_00560 [Pseudogymnoascus sp. WSF 3629]|nr:hypothetical protein VE00_00560 [Pseudogymnoascus sp. WSF 3629]